MLLVRGREMLATTVVMPFGQIDEIPSGLCCSTLFSSKFDFLMAWSDPLRICFDLNTSRLSRQSLFISLKQWMFKFDSILIMKNDSILIT